MSAAPEPRLLILADHPSLHRGFATVARDVAGHLHERSPWTVELLGYYPPDPDWRSPGYRVTALDETDDPRSMRLPKLTRALVERFSEPGPAPGLLLCIGTDFDLAAALEAVQAAGLRERVTLLGYTPVDHAPLPAAAMDVLCRFDLLVPYTRLAREALVDCAARAGVDAGFLGQQIPHGVDTGRFRPLPEAERAAVRREAFGLDEGQLLIGYFGRNSGNKRVDIVLRIFALAVTGAYVRCARCGGTSAGALDRDGAPLAPPPACNACGGGELSPGRKRDDLRLYLHTDLDAYTSGAASGGRNLLAIAEPLGIGDRVLSRRDLRIGHGDDAERLARRMAACDLHMLPYHAAGWELTVLETGACGVPNIITEVSSPPEYAEPFSRLVPVGSYVLTHDVAGLMDTDLGLAALLALLDDPAQRCRLGRRGPETARQFDWARVGARWIDALEPFLPRS